MIKLLTPASAVRRHTQSTLHTATLHVLAARVSCAGVSSKPSQWECLLLGALKVGERLSQLMPLNSCTSEGKGEGARGGGARYGGQRRHLFSLITIKPRNPAESQTALGGSSSLELGVTVAFWIQRSSLLYEHQACCREREEHLNAVSLSFINRCPSVQSLNGGGTLEDKGSCFLLCSHLQALTLLPLLPRRK